MKAKNKNVFSYICFSIVRFFVLLFYPKIKIEGLENLPCEPCIIVGNHTKMNGPLVSELYLPFDRAIWCAGQMMHLKDVPAYAFEDFWGNKPKKIQWLYKIVSYFIAPLSVIVFNNAHTIGVYRDNRIMSTFKETVTALKENKNIIIFPECATAHNNIVNEFQQNFIDVARLYYKRTKKEVCFVPMYIAPTIKKAVIGKPVRFNAQNENELERVRLCEHLMNDITHIALSLPRHIVVPYNNVPKKEYPYSKDIKED